jgi:hypothetical protein
VLAVPLQVVDGLAVGALVAGCEGPVTVVPLDVDRAGHLFRVVRRLQFVRVCREVTVEVGALLDEPVEVVLGGPQVGPGAVQGLDDVLHLTELVDGADHVVVGERLPETALGGLHPRPRRALFTR